MKGIFSRRLATAAELSLTEAIAEAAQYVGDHVRRNKLATIAVVGAFVYSSVITAKGMADTAVEAGVASLENMIAVGLGATTSSLLLGTATISLMGLATVAARKHCRSVLALAVLLAPFTAGISTYSAIQGNAGQPALVYDMRDKASGYANYLEHHLADAAGASNTAAALEPLKSSICVLADKEGSSGVLTGAAGKGSVQAAYIGACESTTIIIEIALETAARTDERRDEGGLLVQDMAAIADEHDINVFERQRLFRDASKAVLELIAESRTEDVTRRVRAQLDILEASIASVGIKDGVFGKTQADAIENLKTSLTAVKGIVNDLLAGPDGPHIEPPGDLHFMAAAVWEYRLRVLPQIMIAIAADLMPYWYFGLLFLSKAMADSKSRGVHARRRILEAKKRAQRSKPKRKRK